MSAAGDAPLPRALVVDDTPMNRDLLTRRVTRDGYEAEVAANGREALERLRAEPFDLVLLDVQMPEMDGPALLAVLRQDVALAHVPVIVISAVDDPKLVVRCIELGAVDYLPKLHDPVLLRARMRAALGRRAGAPERHAGRAAGPHRRRGRGAGPVGRGVRRRAAAQRGGGRRAERGGAAPPPARVARCVHPRRAPGGRRDLADAAVGRVGAGR